MKFAYLIEPPFNYRDNKGVVKGHDVDLARYVFSVLNIPDVEFVEAEFADLLPGLEAGHWDVTTGLIATKERSMMVQFGRPIWVLPDGLLVREEAASAIAGYSSFAQTSALRLAVIRDQLQHRHALSFDISDDRIVIFDTYLEAAEAVENGDVDAYASVAKAHQGYLKHNHKLGLRLVTVPTTELQPSFGCFSFALESSELKRAFDEALNAFIGCQDHLTLARQYGFSDKDVELLRSRCH